MVKELRLQGINSIEDANEFLKEYKYELTDKFAVKPKSNINAHRTIQKTKEELNVIFSIQAKRIVSKNLEVRYENKIYKIESEGLNLTKRGADITVCKSFDGKVLLL